MAEFEAHQTSRSSLLQTIINLCEVFTKNVMIERTSRRGHALYSITNRNEIDDTSYNNYMVYGAKLIFLIRHKLLNETIDFYFTGETSNALIAEKDVLANLTMVSNHAVGLTYSLEQHLIQHASKERMKKSVMAQWETIKRLADTDGIWDGSADVKIKGHQAYKKNGADANIFATFAGDNSVLSTYYNLNGSYRFYNQGWLWEWFLDKYYNSDSFEIKGSLQPLFEGTKTDNIRGTRQGDLRIKGQWVQAKNKNESIITVNSILEILFNLTATLKQLQIELKESSVSSKTVQTLTTQLNRFFIPKEIKAGEKKAEEYLSQIFSMLGI